VIIRCGLPKSSGLLPRRAGELGYDVLLSAGSLWEEGRFVPPGSAVWRCRSVALDSAGFVAMKLHGGYRWTVAEYVALAAAHPWAWWSQMDLCCEPEIAGDAVTVAARVEGTVQLLRACREEAAGKCGEPMPILQGWGPDDYRRCGDGFDAVLSGVWPDLVGLGSVCRRKLGGPAGLWSILANVDRWLPPRVKLHLFGVKGDALPELRQNPRIASTDSCAWDLATRKQVIAGRKKHMQATGCDIGEATKALPCKVVARAAEMERWMGGAKQGRSAPRQLSIWEGVSPFGAP
jgi:hypothetical protein